MTKNQEMLKAMDEEERHAWAVQRLCAYFRSLRHEGFSLEEIGYASIICGGGALAAGKGKTGTVDYLYALARRLIENPESMPAIDEASGPELLM